MTLRVKLTKDEVNSGRIIPNGEYVGIVHSITEDETQGGDWMVVADLKVEGHREYAGVVVRDWLGKWFRGADKLRRFIEALTNSPYDYEKEYDLTKATGTKVRFFNQQGTDNQGRPCNSIVDYQQMK